MGVSIHEGSPKSSIFVGCPFNHPAIGVALFMESLKKKAP